MHDSNGKRQTAKTEDFNVRLPLAVCTVSYKERIFALSLKEKRHLSL